MVRILAATLAILAIVGCREDKPEVTESTKFIVSAGVQKAEAAELKVQSAAVDSE